MKLWERDGDWLEGKNFDAWKVRDYFLASESDAEILNFLNKTGHFSKRLNVKGAWSYDSFRMWHTAFRGLLQRHPSGWGAWASKQFEHEPMIIKALQVYSQIPVDFRWTKTQHYAFFKATDTLGAILATIYIDKLRGAKHGFCARPDCRKDFEFISKHKRKYCSPSCAHLETVRRLRERQKSRKQEKRRV
ncbi:MAG: hypothetical protein JWO20_993 [Candidatus Angelobacter sp.]|nr:hypothetical protein [Candidatus Angelobacter sp.]